MPEARPWWRHAVVYQVYLRSFADGNGDGTGDIAGLRSRLPYLEGLGVDAIWVNPWYRSPMHDGGYDVADYRDIDPGYGTMDEAVELISEARARGIRVLVDLVPNHTSSEHRWFVEALRAGPGSPARDRYHFLPGRGPDGALPPNDWTSVFGGPAWTRVPDGEWYLHLFDETQPDLNWQSPEVHEEFEKILRYWLDRGASGFRVDVAHGLAKAPGYPDLGERHEGIFATRHGENHPFWDRPELHDIVREWRSVLDEYPESVMVAEAWVDSWADLAAYLRPGEFHQAFDFLFLQTPWTTVHIREAIDEALVHAESVGSVPTWALSNHDVVRHATRLSFPPDIDVREWLLEGDRSIYDPDLGLRRARAASLLVLALPGSVYLFQGEELGLPEVIDLPIEVLQDPVWERSGRTLKGRDGARVPIPWANSGSSFGFGSDGSWLPQPDGWGRLSVEAQTGVAGSTLEMYRSALRIRNDIAGDDEVFRWLDVPGEVICFQRSEDLICLVNLGEEPVGVPAGDVLIGSGPLQDGRVPADTAVWVRPSR
ncbi:MAG: glycoside hydrolase family 13 protein [Acidimicrobiia bacterium]